MATPDTNFTQLMDDMQSFADKTHKYLTQDGTQRLWMIPTNASSHDPTDIQSLEDGFDRSTLNANYAAEYNGSGEDHVRVVMGTNMQICYMGMMERAFRERHRTACRPFSHLAGRKKAHGIADGVHKGSVWKHVDDTFKS